MQGKDGVGVPVKVLVDSQPALDIVYNQMFLARPQEIWHGTTLSGTGGSSKKSCTSSTLVQAMGADIMTNMRVWPWFAITRGSLG